jgi:hypothetical protein
MSRLRRVAHGIASGYAVLIVTVVFQLASYPLALHFLPIERLYIWGLMSAIGGFLSQIDLGMSGSVARLLVDHKDDRARGTYGSLIKTGWLVLIVQGILVWLAGSALAPVLPLMYKNIPPDLEPEFIALLRWQSVTWGLGFATRIFGHLLQAHQRVDIINYSQIGALGLNFGALWFFLHAGQGVFSLAWAVLAGMSTTALVTFVACCRLQLFPPAQAWGRLSWPYFKEMFDYGKDMFLVGVGTQLILASQSLIITREVSLTAGFAWSVGTKAFTYVSQAIYRIFDMSAPAFSEMMVRREHALLRERYRGVLALTASAAAFSAVTYAMCNSLFVTVWLHGKIEWPPVNDLLLGVWMIVSAALHCHNCFVLLTKKVDAMRYIYFLEGSVFVISALLVAKWAGLPGIIICSIICSVLFSGAYGAWRISQYFEVSLAEVAFRWLAPLDRVLVLFGPVAIAGWWAFRSVDQPAVRLAGHVLLCSSVGVYVLLRYGLTRPFQLEILRRAPKQFDPLLRRVFIVSPQ